MTPRTDRLVALRTAVHRQVHPWGVPDSGADQGRHCAACPSITALDVAVSVLEARRSDVRGARDALHRAVCASEFCTGTDHADRSWSTFVAKLRKAI